MLCLCSLSPPAGTSTAVLVLPGSSNYFLGSGKLEVGRTIAVVVSTSLWLWLSLFFVLYGIKCHQAQRHFTFPGLTISWHEKTPCPHIAFYATYLFSWLDIFFYSLILFYSFFFIILDPLLCTILTISSRSLMFTLYLIKSQCIIKSLISQ